mmetsp:Transcript_53533/g.85311  ORF Transcript_53533/g.85311 Transcript_53533/m.85311 type:complete len:240 (+) Transcript_53533:653-1372(+)
MDVLHQRLQGILQLGQGHLELHQGSQVWVRTQDLWEADRRETMKRMAVLMEVHIQQAAAHLHGTFKAHDQHHFDHPHAELAMPRQTALNQLDQHRQQLTSFEGVQLGMVQGISVTTLHEMHLKKIAAEPVIHVEGNFGPWPRDGPGFQQRQHLPEEDLGEEVENQRCIAVDAAKHCRDGQKDHHEISNANLDACHPSNPCSQDGHQQNGEVQHQRGLTQHQVVRAVPRVHPELRQAVGG